MLRVALLLCCLAGCSFDTTVEGSPRVLCGDDAQCPPDFFCQASIGECVRVLSPGLRPPGLAGPAVVSPTLAGRGVGLRVSFGVSEPLAQPPVVRAVYASGASAALQPVTLEASPLDFVFTLQPAADAPEGAVRFFADLLDTDGAEARAVELGAARLDFTPPALVRGAAAVTLLPSATNQLARVEAMNETTLAQLTFAVTEPLRRAPALHAEVGGDAQAFDVRFAGSTGTSHLFTLTLAAREVPQGPATLSVDLEDLAGNTAVVPLELKVPGLVVDTLPPPLEGLADGGVVLLRAPSGAAFRLGTRGTTVTGAAGVTEPGSTLIASEAPTSAELARTVATAQGAFELTLPADLPGVTLRALDAAGNQSTPALVQQASWFASVAGSAPGAANPIPHRAFTTRVLGPTPEPVGALEHYPGTSSGAALTSGAVNWRRLTWGTPSTANTGARVVAAWDPFQAKVLGVDGNNSSLGLHEWNGGSWRFVTPLDPEADGNPSSGSLQSTGGAAFDEDQRLLMLVTGSTATLPRSTWGWNGRSWVLLAQESTTRCTGCTLTWDSARRRVLLFDPPSGTTATWDPSLRGWRTLSASATPSLLATTPAMAFERHTGRWVRFGGLPVHAETWVFDGTAWTRATAGGPPARWGGGMAYDPVLRRTRLQGGVGADGGTLQDLWEWDGATWRALADTGVPRRTPTLVVAPAFEQTLLVGSGDVALLLPDAGFRVASTNVTLLPRSGPSTTLSLAADTLVIAGGITDAGVTTSSVQGFGPGGLVTLPTLPEARSRGAVGAHDVTGQLFYVGGATAQGQLSASTFVTSDAGAWLALDAGPRLVDGGAWPRAEALVFYEPSRSAMVMLGGLEATGGSKASFVLTQDGWSTGGPALPVGPGILECFHSGSVARSPSGVALMYPGLTGNSTCAAGPYGQSFWLYSITAGVFDVVTLMGALNNTASSPLAHDDRLGSWVAFGGRQTSTSLSGDATLRLLAGGRWVPVPVVDTDGDESPSARYQHAFGYLKTRGRLVLVGGETNGRLLDDAWDVELAGARPAYLLRLALREALPRGAAPVAVRLEGLAGADDTVTEGNPGVAVWAWHQQRWLDLGPARLADGGVHLAPASRPERFTVTVADAAVLADLLAEPTLTLAVVPAHGFITTPPRLAVEGGLEVRLDYAFPGGAP